MSNRLQNALRGSGYFETNIPTYNPHDISQSEFLSREQLKRLGFKSVGENTQISNKCSFYAIDGHIGNNVRIDDFCILKGNINIGHSVHICAYSMISGAQAPVTVGDFCVLSARCSVFTGSNDHSADVLPAPLAPKAYTKQSIGPVEIGTGVMVGAHVVILPNVKIKAGASVGAGCIVSSNLQEGEQLRTQKPYVLSKKRDATCIKNLSCVVLDKSV